MKITSLKAILAKVATVGLLAGAVVLASPAKAEAQVRIGVRFGAPVYAGPVYARPYYGPRYVYPAPVYGYPAYGYPGYRRYEWERHERFADDFVLTELVRAL